jgi:lysophospholipid acyltransferase (LPLAT)-like uncharacterized protein
VAFSFKQRVTLAIIPPIAATLIRLLGMTLRYRDIAVPGIAIDKEVPAPCIYAFWHRTLLVCAHRFRNRDIAILISPSFDGELIARTVEYLGFYPVRGSSSRGGAVGLRNMAQAYTDGHRCAITADGPRGPNMVAKPGPIQVAELTGATWVGAYYALPDRAWQLRSWDRFLIPKPFSTVTFTWPAHATIELASVQRALDEAVEMANT